MLTSLYRAWLDADWKSQSDFVDDVIATAKRDVDIKPSDGNLDGVARNLISIFEPGGSLGTAAKAAELLSENERVLCGSNCRVLTDLRPIFSADITKNPKSAVIQHVLKIAFHDAGEDIKEFYVAMDGDDVRYLQNLFERAIEKEHTLRSSLSGAGIAVVGQDETEES